MITNVACVPDAGRRPEGLTPRLASADGDFGVKRGRILTHATREFLKYGFDGANLDDIANAAGVGKVTIYRFFEHKAGLFAQCVLQAVSDANAPLRNLLDLDLPVEQALIKFAEAHAKCMLHLVAGVRPFYDVMRMVIGTSVRYPELADACREAFHRDVGLPLVTYFQAAIDRGEVVFFGDAHVLSDRFLHIISFTAFAILDPKRAPATSDLRSYAEQGVQLFLHGCAPMPNDGKPSVEWVG